jgi:hypothetical protein
MTDLKFTLEDVNEAFFNIGKLSANLDINGRKDDAIRLNMIAQIISSFLTQVIEENKHLKGGDDLDMDGRC